MTKRCVFALFLLVAILPQAALAVTYYVSESSGSDTNSGLSSNNPFQSLAKVNSLALNPGDQVLFRSGESWAGMLWPQGSGTAASPIVLDAYDGDIKPIIDGDGYQASLLLFNDDHYVIRNLELTNQNSHLDASNLPKLESGFSGSANDNGSGENVRFGIKIVASNRSLDNFSFSNLLIRDIYPSPSNANNLHQGYGIKFESQSNANTNTYYTISDVLMEQLVVTRTGHYGIWIRPLGLNGIDDYKHNNFTLRHSQFLDTGGSGFVPVKASNVLVEHNLFDGTGSSVDARMWKRGSGLWPFDAQDVVIQYNTVMNARGPLDSYGIHIDYNNVNVVVQYNFSYNNEGGFVQILGANENCGYRYNISVADGYRLQGVNGGQQDGRIFNVSDFCNVATGCQSSGNFIYNNTVYVPASFSPDIVFQAQSGETFFHNNLIVVAEGSPILQSDVATVGVSYDMDNNLFYPQHLFSLNGTLANGAVYGDPKLIGSGESSAELYKILSDSAAIGAGSIIAGSPVSTDYRLNNGGLDYFGQPVSDVLSPNIGAYNGQGDSGPVRNALIGWQTFDPVIAGDNNSQVADNTPDTNSTYDITPVGSISQSGHYLTGVIGASASILGYAGHGPNISSNFLNGSYFGGSNLGEESPELIVNWPLADGSPGQRIGPFATPNNNLGSSWKFRENDGRRRGDFKVTNHSDYFFQLNAIHFVARIGTANSPDDLSMIYLPGAVDGSDGVQLIKSIDGLEVGDSGAGPLQTSLFDTADPGQVDFSAAPAVLGISRSMESALGTTVYLEPGASASFRFIWSGQASNFAESQIDNLALEGGFYLTPALEVQIDPVSFTEETVSVLPMLYYSVLAVLLAIAGALTLQRRVYQ